MSTGTITVSRADEVLLRALASVVTHAEEKRRTRHLRQPTVDFADRVRRALPKEGEP